MYYTAKKHFYHCTKDSITKYIEQGYLDEKIANIFHQRNYRANRTKHLSYEASAISYYMAAKDTQRAGIAIMQTIAAWTYLRYDLSGDTALEPTFEIYFLRFLGEWYRNYRAQDSIMSQSEEDSWGLYSIATILRAEKKFDTSLNYYIEALMNVLDISALKHLQGSIINVSFAYALLGNKTLSNKYLDLNQSIAKKTNSGSDIFWNILNKSYNYYYLKEFDSALILANRIQFDTSLRTVLPHTFYNQLIGYVYGIKYKLLDSLRLDSARLYQSYSQNNLNSYLEEYSRLLQIEAKESQDWLSDIKDEDKNISDALNNGIIAGQKEKNRNDRAIRNYIIGGLGALLLLAFIFFYWKRKYDRKRAKSEYDRVNELAKNKIHNFKSDITDIDNLAKKGDLDLLNAYMEAYKSFLKIFLSNWSKDKVSLREEFIELESYYNVKRVKKNIEYFKQIKLSDENEILFLQSVFDTLLDNSVKHGFKNRQTGCKFAISLHIENESLICEYTDNGAPPTNNDRYLEREDSGLNTLKKRIELFYNSVTKKPKSDFFLVEALPENKGTFVKLILPHEKI